MNGKTGIPSIGWNQSSRFAGPENSPGFNLWTDFLSWQRGLNRLLKPYGLTQPRFSLLAVVGWMSRGGSQPSQAEVARFTGMEPMQVSQGVRRLESDGFLMRVRSGSDKRGYSLSMTDEGLETLARTLPEVEDYDEQYFGKPT